jgi:hypothetical protein
MALCAAFLLKYRESREAKYLGFESLALPVNSQPVAIADSV